MTSPSNLLIHGFVIGLLLNCTTANAQGPVLLFWDVESGNWKDSGSWFGGFTPPEAGFGEIGVVNNRGTAIVDSNIDSGPGGIILGEQGNHVGTLEIHNGGEITVSKDLDDVVGEVRVGQAGRGTLVVERGGTLTAESLRSGGNSNSSIVFGTGDSGKANITINGSTNLARNTRIIGPNVNFNAQALSLSGRLTSDIFGTDHSTLDISGTATLGGVLDLQFMAPFAPEPDQTWDLVDASEVNGNFASVTSNVSPGPGLTFTVNTVDGGSNGQLAQVGIDARLLLAVDRRSGATRLQNHAPDKSITINGYGVTSAGGAIDDGAWTPLSEGGPWSGNGSSTHVAELSLAGSLEIGPGADVDMGHIYAFAPTELGESLEDLAFQYHVESGNVEHGLIDYTGPHNDVVLVVDDDAGVFIQNQSLQDATINGYTILSDSGSLDPSGWTSFGATDEAWRESNPASNHITELSLSGARTLAATSEAISLGKIATGAEDLVFMINIAGEGPYVGTVEYHDGVMVFAGGDLTGDCNGDGKLNSADFLCVSTIPERDAVLAAIESLPGDFDGDRQVAFPDFLVLSANFGNEVGYNLGNVDLQGQVAFPDFLILSANFGKSPAAAIPEPSGCLLITFSLLYMTQLRKRGTHN